MTQEQLAEKSTVGVRTIRRMETGAVENFRLDTVRLLADALNLTPDERRDLMSAAGAVPALPDEPEPEPGPDPPGGGPLLAGVADRLADVLQGRWRREVEQRGAHNPFPLPIRWQPVPDDLADHWDNIRRVPPGGSASPLDLTGDLTEIADVYRRVPSGRLVVLGRAGSGKTILTLRFVLDYLATRTSTDPVPVIFSLGSWDPTTDTLRDWLVDRLLRDHPDLVAGAPGGSTLAAALVEAGRILPVLDGFDEIPDGLHRAALPALNRTSLPMLLTSRPHEYRRAVAAGNVLTWAAGIRIVDLTPADFSDYLRRSSRTTRWDPVLRELRERPHDPAGRNLIEVFGTPLMVVLARTTYDTDSDPASLLDTNRFPTPNDLEDHLLDGFVPTLYRAPSAGLRHPAWTADRVQHWLGHLACHLDRLGTPDLAWWQLGNSFSRSSRILGVTLTSAMVTTLSDWLVYGPRYVHGFGFATGLRKSLLDGLTLGPMVGLGFGMVYGLMIVCGGVVFEPARVQMRLFGRNSRTPVVRTFTTRFGAGLLGGFAVGLGYPLMIAIGRETLHGFPSSIDVLIKTSLINMLVYGFILGLAAGVVFGLTSVLEAPVDLDSATSPLAMLRSNRTTAVRRALVVAPIFILAIAFGGTLVSTFLQDPLNWSLSYALAAGLLGGLAGALSHTFAFTAWGQWLVFSRVWLPLTGKLPWAVTTFLDDAYHRGVLRQVGAVYQFRHARLQDHLGHAFRRTAPADDRHP
ncbi:helix-turn-helix domain-containing protein (plasmid) [Embleya sp. NBC_00888]|uniref:helix-turn-helix domain-containing protein n=1 Tax=Embleya sp. NBC_00888 TaxID=2975960 RepID=UPI002F9145F8|nr:helix-turn-helix domain-containing protein [Embleya sp. NBC_00888]